MSRAWALAWFRAATGALLLLMGPAFGIHHLGWEFLGAWTVAAACILVGWYARVFAVLLLPIIGVLLYLAFASYMYLLGILALFVALSDCERKVAIRTRGTGRVPGWTLVLMRCQLSIVYGFTALAKINPHFLEGEMVRTGMQASVFPLPDLSDAVYPALMAAAIAAELGVAVLPWFRPWWALSLAIPLHAFTVAMAPSWSGAVVLAVFAGSMLALLIAFFVSERRPVATVRTAARWATPHRIVALPLATAADQR
jgi:hypothetical protein